MHVHYLADKCLCWPFEGIVRGVVDDDYSVKILFIVYTHQFNEP